MLTGGPLGSPVPVKITVDTPPIAHVNKIHHLCEQYMAQIYSSQVQKYCGLCPNVNENQLIAKIIQGSGVNKNNGLWPGKKTPQLQWASLLIIVQLGVHGFTCNFNEANILPCHTSSYPP